MLQNQLANYGDKMFDKDTAAIVRNHAMLGAVIMALPLFGLEWIVFCIILWHMYSDLCERANTTLNISSIIVGLIVNIVIAVVIDLILTFIPIIGWLGTAFVVYLQFYLSGKSFLETLKSKENVADISRKKQTDYNERIDGYNKNTTEASPKVTQERTVIQPESLRSEESNPIANLVLKNDQAIAVDLGLSVKWADCNVGGTSEAPVGGLFGWADPTGNKTSHVVGDYVPLSSFLSHAISENISGTEYDIATVQWGGNWRMPTKKEWKELIDKCKWSKESQFNVMGYRVEGPNGNSIFLPCTGLRFGNEVSETDCGCYWTSEMVANDRCMAHYYYFDGEKHNDIVDTRNYVYSGRAIRPVYDTSEKSNLKDDTPSINEEPVVEKFEKSSGINQDSIQATLEDSQQETSSEVATSNETETVLETATNIDAEETSENGFFLSNKVVLGIGLVICILYFLNESLFTFASFCLASYGLFLSLLIIKRVVLDKDERVKPTRLAVASFVILLIAIFIPEINPDYLIKSKCNIYNNYPFVVYSQYTMQRSMIWFVIAFAVDCTSKLFMFKFAKPRCKLPLKIYMIGCLSLITFAFVGKYFFDGAYICLLLLACAPLLLSNIMLLYRGSEEDDVEDVVNRKIKESDDVQLKNNEISTIKASEQPVENECSPIADRILFACPTCGSEQVHKSIGGMIEHAAAVGTVKLAAEEKLATKEHLYYCPSCNLIWTSDETDNRKIIIRDFVDFYNANSRKYPDRPKVNNFFDKHDSFYTVGFIVGILFLLSLYKVITEDITYGVYEFIMAISVLYWAIIVTTKTVFHFNYKEDLKKYANEIEEIDIYNDNLKNDLLQRFNTIVNNNSPRLGETLNELPFNDEKRDLDDLDDAIDDARTSILVFWGVILLAIALAIGVCSWSSDAQSVSKEEYPAETTNQGEIANSGIGSETDSEDVVYTDDAFNTTEQDAPDANEEYEDGNASTDEAIEKETWVDTPYGFSIPSDWNGGNEIFNDDLCASIITYYKGQMQLCYWPLIGSGATLDIPSPGYNISETVCIKNVTYSSKNGVYSGYANDGRIWYMKKVIYNGGEVVHSKLLVLIYPKSMQSEATPFINIIKNWR